METRQSKLTRSRLHQQVVRVVKATIKRLANMDSLWQLTGPFSKLVYHTVWERQRTLRLRQYEQTVDGLRTDFARMLPDLTVAAGPFQGMRYPGLDAVGSSIFPKLLGTYEAELHVLIGQLLQRNYKTIIDIGSAEGYYAVGLAKHTDCIKVYAFDTDPQARELTRRMAALNGVADKVDVEQAFTLGRFVALDHHYPGLIISDCEGAEEDIFFDDVAARPILAKYDLLIELHEYLRPGVAAYLTSLFYHSHHAERILSVDDILRPYYFPCAIIQNEPIARQVQFMAERRPAQMEWLFLQAK